MSESKTKKTPTAPIIGGIFGDKGGFEAVIKKDNGKTYKGYGSTASQAEKNASKKANSDKR